MTTPTTPTTPQDVEARAREARALTDDLATESYYAVNLGIVLYEATPEERATLRAILDRASAYRLGGVAR